ncbi:uncharacterized protein LOC113206776 [Frankliniella occidentalis]|uniref:Uncharacterized protein LOC113206776 n=1 Tax=Frankliniella occidentalis TaxID=133901 RepID=A0A9C6WQR2_FRAOC|nr:uncharacterized protein LOC113206776 [Frankliniella occidentalis]XP_052124742.1 uncharacterized protein LOC113206776 [Frankliniella occidentalis]
MDRLPDDALLEVLKRLDVADLLACRLVCKRLAALALHPDAWRHRHVVESGCLCPTLRLAPCLARLEVKVRSRRLTLKGRCTQEYATTCCAAAQLHLTVEDYSEEDAALIIRRQGLLGRLKRLEVTWRDSSIALDDSVLLTAVASTSGLHVLRVRLRFMPSNKTDMSILTKNLLSIAVPCSIREFECGGPGGPGTIEPFVNYVLERHAAALETVDLLPDWCWTWGRNSSVSTSTAAQLAGLPKLRSLACHLFPEVTACKTLRFLKLGLLKGSGLVQGLFRHVEQLQEVALSMVYTELSQSDVLSETILALTGSHLKSLMVAYETTDAAPVAHNDRWSQALLSVLPLLPALQDLAVSWPTDQLLRGINPITSPALRRLILSCPERTGACPQALVHTGAVRDLFSANPSVCVGVRPPCPGVCNCMECVGVGSLEEYYDYMYDVVSLSLM